MSDPGHILVVDDEPQVRRTVGDYLALHGFRVETAASADEARARLRDGAFDLVVLDLRMPGEDGLSLARHIREAHAARVVMLTAAGDVVDRVVGLEVGADDYLAKPAELPELVARIRAVLRPLGRRARPHPEDDGREAVGRCRLERESHTLVDEDGREVAITAMDFAMLVAFVDNPGRVLSRNQLSQIVRGKDWSPADRSIDIRIGRLRRKLEVDARKPRYLKTVHGLGYVYSPSGR